MMNILKTLVFSALATIMVTVSAPAAEPGKNGMTKNFLTIGAVTPYVAFGEVDPGGYVDVGARIALSGVADMTLGYSLLIAPPSAGDQGYLAPAHSLILGFSFKF